MNSQTPFPDDEHPTEPLPGAGQPSRPDRRLAQAGLRATPPPA